VTSTDEFKKNSIRLDAGFAQDPHQLYRRLRTEAPVQPVVMTHGARAWIVTRHADVRAALAHPALAKDIRASQQIFDAQGVESPLDVALRSHMLFRDPPDHTRLRRLVNKAFTVRSVQSMRPRIGEICDELIADIWQEDVVDLLTVFAFPLPLMVICELLGIPIDARDDVRRWVDAVLGDGVPSKEVRPAGVEMVAYLKTLIADKRARPRDDMLTALVQARDDGDALDEAELVSMSFLLLVAGLETTVNLIGNGTLTLLRHPEQFAALRADRTLLPSAVEEFLRYEAPVNLATMRFTSEPVTIGGVDIPANEFVFVGLASANRDEARFDDPDRLDITRPPGGHFSFGHGIHYCIGAPLGKMEAEIAFDRLLDAFPRLSLAVDPAELVWRQNLQIRGLKELPVRLR